MHCYITVVFFLSSKIRFDWEITEKTRFDTNVDSNCCSNVNKVHLKTRGCSLEITIQHYPQIVCYRLEGNTQTQIYKSLFYLILIVSILQCVKERHSFECHSQNRERRKSATPFLSKGAIWKWHSYFWGERKYDCHSHITPFDKKEWHSSFAPNFGSGTQKSGAL